MSRLPWSLLSLNGIGNVTEDISDTKRFYLIKIEKVSDAVGLNSNETVPGAKSPTSNTDISVSDIFEFVKKHDVNYEADSKHPVYFSPKPVNPLLLNEGGTPKVWYHQTDSKISEFDLDKQTNSVYDSETPNGIFLKSSDKDIGLQGKSQMNLYPAVSNILQFKNREEAKALRDCDRMCRSRGFFYLRK